jgi:hypothetical protein
MAKQVVSLDNKTIAKIAIAISTANELISAGDNVPGPMVRKILEALDLMERMEHFRDYRETPSMDTD